MMNAIILVCSMILFSSATHVEHTKKHRCEVSVTDFNVDNKVTLGSFTTDVKPSLTTKSFGCADGWFVNASVLYLDPQREVAPPSEVILTLALSKKAYSAIEAEMKQADVISNARATIPLKSFDHAKVETIYLGKKQPVIIGMTCAAE